MLASPETLDQLRATFARMQQQGLSAEFAGQAQACAEQLLATLDHYGAPALAGFGAVLAILNDATEGSPSNMAKMVHLIKTHDAPEIAA